MPLRIEMMTKNDWPEVRSIYEEGLATRLDSHEKVRPESNTVRIFTSESVSIRVHPWLFIKSTPTVTQSRIVPAPAGAGQSRE